MAAVKTKTKAEPNIIPGRAVEYNGEQYTVVQTFGPRDKYAVIQNEKKRISVEIKALAVGTRRAAK